MKKINGLVLSTLTAALLVGCGSSSTSSDVDSGTTQSITVERGKVIGAKVVDSSTPAQTGISTSNDNIYEFEDDVVYPIIVTGGFIDVDGNGVYSEGDTELGNLQMKSYSEVVTPITTYIASKLDALSEDKREEAMTQAYEELATSLGIEDIDDLKKVPSSMSNKTSLIAVNAIYKEILESTSVESLDLELLKDEYKDLTETLKDIEDVKEMEKATIEKIVEEHKDDSSFDFKVVDSDDVKSYISSYNLFGYSWKEVKEFKNGEYSDGNLANLSDDNKSISIKAVKTDDIRSRMEIKTNLTDLASNSVSGTITLVEGGKRSSGFMLVGADVSLDETLNKEFSSVGENKYFIVYTKISGDKIYIAAEIGGDDNSVTLDSAILDSEMTNVGKSFTINTSYVDGIVSVSVDGIDTRFEYEVPTGATIDEFSTVKFRADVDGTQTDVTEDDAVIEVTDFTAITKTLSAAVQAIKIIENMDVEQDNVDTKLTEAKAKVDGLTSNDAVMVASMLDLTSIVNSDEVSKIIDISATSIGETTDFGKLVKSTVNDTIEVNEKYNGISTNARIIMHNFATSLKEISDNIGKVFEDEEYVFEYGSEEIVYNDSLALRGSILGLAAQLDFIAAYSWGSDDDIKVRTYTTGGYSYDYQDINVYTDKSLNNGMFKIDSGSRIDTARAYLIEGLNLMNSLPLGYDDVTQEDKDEVSALLSSIKGGESYKMVDEWTEWNGTSEVTVSETTYVDLSKFYNSTYAIDVKSFGTNFSIACDDENDTFDEARSKMENGHICSNSNAYLESSVSVTTSNSKLDDVFTKIIDTDGKVYTGQDLIDYILD